MNFFLTAAGVKDSILVTPLMEFVRQKRAMKSMPQVHIFVLFEVSYVHSPKWCICVDRYDALIEFLSDYELV